MRSAAPSPFKSAAVSPEGEQPTGKLVTENWAAPLLFKTEILSVPGFAVVKSGMPSKLKSAEVISKGKLSMGRGTVVPGENIPNPLFKRIDTVLSASFTTARSITPSPLKSPAVISDVNIPSPIDTGLTAASVNTPHLYLEE